MVTVAIEADIINQCLTLKYGRQKHHIRCTASKLILKVGNSNISTVLGMKDGPHCVKCELPSISSSLTILDENDTIVYVCEFDSFGSTPCPLLEKKTYPTSGNHDGAHGRPRAKPSTNTPSASATCDESSANPIRVAGATQCDRQSGK